MSKRKSNKQVKAMLWELKKQRLQREFARIASRPEFYIKANR